MPNYFKHYERRSFTALSGITVVVGILGIIAVPLGWSSSQKLIASCGLLATLTGLVQLEISGLFDRISKEYGDEEKYPDSPPSYITREIIDDPDHPFRNWLRNVAFFRPETGFLFIVTGTVIQLIAVWVEPAASRST
jgi:hypothetical protein